MQKTKFFVILGYFLPFYPSNNTKNQNFEKNEKNLLEILSFYTSALNENHMMYDSWDMEHSRQNFFSFWTIFCPFTLPPPDKPENQNFEKMKKHLEISSFYTSVP